VVAFRAKNKRWAEYITFINDTRFHDFGLRDLGRGLTVLYEGKDLVSSSELEPPADEPARRSWFSFGSGSA
jgi:hypothetical protein